MDRYRKNILKLVPFLFPALFFYTLLLVYPIIKTFGLSFFSWNGISGTDMNFIGIDNFIRAFHDAAFLTSLKNFAMFVIISLLVEIPISLLLALILSIGLKGTRFFKAAFFMPIIFSATAVSLMWKFILMPQTGLLDMILTSFGMEDKIVLWLADPKYATLTLIFINCWQNMGTAMIIFLSGLVAIPRSYYEAAEVDGANAFVRLFKITIPMLWETLKINVILIVIGTTKIFDIVYVLTNGGPNNATDVMSTLMFKTAFQTHRYGYASAIAVNIFIIGFVLTTLANIIMKRDIIEM